MEDALQTIFRTCTPELFADAVVALDRMRIRASTA
jgi:hypothetical protein